MGTSWNFASQPRPNARKLPSYEYRDYCFRPLWGSHDGDNSRFYIVLVLGNVEFVKASAVRRDLLVPSAQKNTARRWRNFIGEHNTVDEQSAIRTSSPESASQTAIWVTDATVGELDPAHRHTGLRSTWELPRKIPADRTRDAPGTVGRSADV